MPISYINYRSFESKTREMVGDDNYSRYRHLLPAVQLVFRERFINTLKCGLDMPSAFDHTYIGCRLPDNHFARFTNYIAARKN
jgi:hypothetical protein